MNYEFCFRTDPGLARENNEDSVAVDEPTRLAILADGMGGYNAGEVASGMATTFIKSELGRWLAHAGRHANGREVRRAMEICVDNANRSIFNAANSNPQYSGMAKGCNGPFSGGLDLTEGRSAFRIGASNTDPTLAHCAVWQASGDGGLRHLRYS